MTLYKTVKALRKWFLTLQCLDTNINTVIPDLYLAILEHHDTVQDSEDMAKVVSAVPGVSNITMSGYQPTSVGYQHEFRQTKPMSGVSGTLWHCTDFATCDITRKLCRQHFIPSFSGIIAVSILSLRNQYSCTFVVSFLFYRKEDFLLSLQCNIVRMEENSNRRESVLCTSLE